MVKKRLAGHGGFEFWDININFNLGQLQSNSLVSNAKVEDLDVTLDNLVGFADRS